MREVMKKKVELPLSTKLFLTITALFLTLVLVFVFFQYSREGQYKAELLNTKLQGYNKDMRDYLSSGDTAEFIKFEQRLLRKGIRTTLMDYSGNVSFDNEASDSILAVNHAGRKEVQDAILHGIGYDIKRESATLGGKWFYSATAYPESDLIVRTAHPYDLSLAEMLSSNKAYLWIGLGLCIFMILIYYMYLDKLRKNIRMLRDFAHMAEEGTEFENAEMEFADDELGVISRNIVSLYAKLQNSEDDKTRLKRQLTQNIAHELKTPVSSISGYIETILDTPDMPDGTRTDFLERCFSQCNRLTHLINDITLLSKIDEASNSFATEDIDLHDVVERINREVALDLKEKDMKLLNLLEPETLVYGNPTLIYSIFRNLTDNAIAYAGLHTSITVQSVKHSRKLLWLRFSDNGAGVPPETLPHLFERFYRVDKGRSRRLGGTGLGLAIVKNAVLIHGGQISVSIARTGGLEFDFSLTKPI